MPAKSTQSDPAAAAGPDDLAFLLVRLGGHVAARFAQALAPLDLQPRQFGLLMRLAAHEGTSQQALGALLDLHPTRMVFLVDELEVLGLVERRPNPDDRRRHALHLTAAGRRVLRRARDVAGRHEEAMAQGLSATERSELTRLLRQLVVAQGLAESGLPGPPAGRAPRRGP